MPQEFRIAHPRSGEDLVRVAIPEDMHDFSKLEVIEAARQLGAVAVNRGTHLRSEQVEPEQLHGQLIGDDGEVIPPGHWPYKPLERYDDAPDRGY